MVYSKSIENSMSLWCTIFVPTRNKIHPPITAKSKLIHTLDTVDEVPNLSRTHALTLTHYSVCNANQPTCLWTGELNQRTRRKPMKKWGDDADTQGGGMKSTPQPWRCEVKVL